MNPWVWRILIIFLAVALVPLIVNATAELVTSAIDLASQSIHSLLRPLSRSGDARLEGIIKLSLYVVSITFLVKLFLGGYRRR